MTKKESFEVAEEVTLTVINCAGNLTIKHGGDKDVSLKGDDFETVEKDTVLHIESRGDLKIAAPGFTQVEAETVSGDCEIKGIEGSIRVNEVMGNLKVRQSSGLIANEVYGDLSGRSIEGDVTVKEVKGDVKLPKINGNVTLDEVMGDVMLQKIDGLINVKSAMGDIKVSGSISAVGGKHHLNANGDVFFYLNADEPVTILATTQGDVVDRTKGKLGLTLLEGEDRDWVISIGEDGPVVVVEALGDVNIRAGDEAHYYAFDGENIDLDLELDLGELGQLGEKIGRMFESFGERMSARFGPDFSDEISSKIDQAIHKATANIEKAERKRVRIHHPFAPKPPQPPKAPKAPKPDTGAQQLKILEMLEAGDISVEDATTLLKALEN